jgi:hypothetical protein
VPVELLVPFLDFFFLLDLLLPDPLVSELDPVPVEVDVFELFELPVELLLCPLFWVPLVLPFWLLAPLLPFEL